MRKIGLSFIAVACLVFLAGCLDAEHRLRNMCGKGADNRKPPKQATETKYVQKEEQK
jgi:hypothetical protein